MARPFCHLGHLRAASCGQLLQQAGYLADAVRGRGWKGGPATVLFLQYGGGNDERWPMSAQVSGADGKGAMPVSPAALEQAIQARRDRLAATIDELTARAQPQEIARRGVADLRDRLTVMTHTSDGSIRTERIAAVVGAIAVLGSVLVVLRRRRG